jgi:cellulose synthase/poly-beta-1,6-N-acetylglucosamine synthase-like glycosyltransferase
VNQSQPKPNRLAYTLFIIPFILTILSWAYFPTAAQIIITNVFGYHAQEQAATPLWLALTTFFYTWYTIIAIGIAGTWIIAALLARKKHAETVYVFPPMVSFVIPAYNQETNITRCINSLLPCTEKYHGNCEIIIVDDGSTDYTYETALSTLKAARATYPRVYCKVSRHMMNLGKIEALRTGVNRALGSVIAVVDADSEWTENTLAKLINGLHGERKAVTGYVNPDGQAGNEGFLVKLQRLEYSRGLGVGRCAQGLGDDVLVVSGAVGVYDADLLRGILLEQDVRSVTEDLEITLELHQRGAKVGYVDAAVGCTVAPASLGLLWRQRLRWFYGWLVNTLRVHRCLLFKRSWVSALLWYSFVFEFFGAFVDLAALVAFPFLWWFAPDRLLFGLNLLVFGLYGFLVGFIFQVVALKLAYGSYTCGSLLFYLPVYLLLRVVNMLARVRSVFGFLIGSNGKWH